MPAVDYEATEHKGLTDAQISQGINNVTKEALKDHGVFLKDDHMKGYSPKQEGEDKRNIMRPWEGDVLASIPSMKQQYTADNWQNDECKFSMHQGIAYITLNRPAANNAMNDGITRGMMDAVYILRERPDIRVAVLTGEGRMFCAGGDPKSFQSFQNLPQEEGGPTGPPPGTQITGAAETLDGNKMSGHGFAKFLYEFANLPQFTICCANGSAMGGGFGLVAICDMCIAVKTAMFVLSEVKLGVIPATISPHVIGKIGVANSKRLFCTAENCNMKTAKQMGLVQEIVESVADFPTVVKQYCKKIEGVAPGALTASKEAMMKMRHATINESLLQYTAAEYARVRKSEEAENGMKAAQAKSKPAWLSQSIKVPGVDDKE